jgi:gamma-glutamyltranspeptidase/glutathione hydrolase
MQRDLFETELFEPRDKTVVSPQRLAFSKHGMVSTAHYEATGAAVKVLAEGGNAVDAAVAAAFSLGVCEPHASGLGGQTMMLLRTSNPGRTVALDGSSRAPNRAAPDKISQKDISIGYRACTVPSTPAVLGYALSKYGTMKLDQVLAPSIEMARRGCQVSMLQHALAKRDLKRLREGSACKIYLRYGRRPYPVGSTLRQPALADTMERLAAEGIEDFYVGEISRRIHRDMEANNGLLRDDDLAQIPWPIERKPVSTRFGALRVRAFPPPGAGRVLIEMLNVLEQFPEKLWDPDTPRGAVLLAEVIRRGAMDRRDRPFDPNFYPQVDDKRMLNRDYAKLVSRQVRRRLRTTGETTHLAVMDRFGNVVALTQSIESVFGSCVATPDLGFPYNNYMRAFDYRDISHPYYMRPNAVPWASVAPTIVFRGRRPWLAIGSPGSERIVSAILQVLLRLRSHTPYEAVAAPRLHCSYNGKVSIEAARFRDDIPKELARRGFEIDLRDSLSFYLGCVQLVLHERGGFVGVADPRRDGSAGGPHS